MWMAIAPRAAGVPDDLGAPELPGSKSHTQRAMLLAAFVPGTRWLPGALHSADTERLAAALQRCGAGLHWQSDGLRVRGRAAGAAPDADVDLGDNGTALRMLLVLVPLLGGRLRVDGSERLRQRPIGPALQALAACGARVDGERLPCTVDGRGTHALPAVIDAAVTTQPASGALLALALRGGGELCVRAPAAVDYLQLTAALLAQCGCTVDVEQRGVDLQFRVGGELRLPDVLPIPADASARAFPLALAALHGRCFAGLLPPQPGDRHPDLGLDADLRALEAPGDLVLAGLHRRPDSVPALAVAAAVRAGTLRIAGVPSLRHKESDRLAALAAGITAAGAAAWTEGDDLLVQGPLRPSPSPRRLPAPADHRIVMALALLGTVLPKGVLVPHADAVGKSWPGFFAWLSRCAAVAAADG